MTCPGNVSLRKRGCRLLAALLIVTIPLAVESAEVGQTGKPPLQFSKDRQIEQMKPKKPVRIKLHRTAKGEYSWDLTGDNVEDIVKADQRLRKLLSTD